MGMHEKRHGKEAIVSEFPLGLRVLAIDNDLVSLKVLEVLLRMRNYRPTIVRDAMTALQMLRDGRDNFDLVVSDVYLSDMDGFKLLKLINLEMDLPVIVLSVDERPEAKKKGIAYGACEYLVKPVQTKHLDIMWRHVMARRTPDPWSFSSSIGNVAAEKAQPIGGPIGGEQDGAKSTKHGWTKSHEHDEDGPDANKANLSPGPSTRKKPRTTWRNELHDKFVEAVGQIGIKRAVPSKILAAMNVDNVSRESVGSHLQKYRMYLARAKDEAEQRRNLLAAERWNLSRDTLEEGIKYFHGHGIYRPTTNPPSWNPTSLPTRKNHPSMFGARGAGIRGGTGSMLFRDVVPRSSSLLSGAGRWPSSSSSTRGESSYMGMLHGNLLGANRSSGSSFADRRGGGTSFPVNQFSVQPSRQLGFQPLVQRSPYGDTRNRLGNSWQPNMKYHNLSRDNWRLDHSRDFWRPTLRPSQSNIPNMNQLTGHAASPVGKIAGQIPMSLNELENQIAAFINRTTSMAGPCEEMASFDVDVAMNKTTRSIEMLNGRFSLDNNTSSVEMPNGNFAINNNISSVEMPNGHLAINNNMSFVEMPNGNFAINNKTSSAEMLNGNFALGSASSIGVAMCDIQMSIPAAPTQMLNDGGAGGVLPAQAQGTTNQEAVDGQLNIDSDDYWEAVNDLFSVNEIFTTINMINEDLLINNSISSVEIPNGHLTINNNTSSVEMSNGNFAINNNMSSVEMPDGNFAINNNMSSVDMPNGNFAINNNMSSMEMPNGNFAINNNTSSMEIRNGSVLPTQSQGTANQEVVDGQLNIDSDDFWEVVNDCFSMDDIPTMNNMLDEDLLINDVNILGGEM